MLDLIKSRRSTRSFSGEIIEDKIISEILMSADCSPKAGGKTRWKFHLIKSREKILEISKKASYYQSFIKMASHIIITELDEVNLYNDYGKRGVELYGIQGSAAAIQNLLLSATYLNVSSCWIGAFNEDEIKKIFKFEGRVIAIIALGK